MIMGTEENGDMGFQNKHLNLKSTIGAESFFRSGWDSESLSLRPQSENFGGSSMALDSVFVNQPFPVLLENQAISGSSHIVDYSSHLGLVEMVPNLPSFESGSFSEMVSSFGLPESDKITDNGCSLNYLQTKEGSNEKTSTNMALCQDYHVSEEGDSPCGRRKRRASEAVSPSNINKNAEGDQQKDPCEDISECLKEQEEKKQKIKQNIGATLRGKQTSKQDKENSTSGETPKDNYVHVRAKRGQATNSHSLAERVRRERISERMRLLQDLVPGCNKITGKAVMLDEIINYVQSLQQQVEFLSMKLAAVNPELSVDMDRILSKDILNSRESNTAIFGSSQGLCSINHFTQAIPQGALPSNPTPPFYPMLQPVWDDELHQILQMGNNSRSAVVKNLVPNARTKSELQKAEIRELTAEFNSVTKDQNKISKFFRVV